MLKVAGLILVLLQVDFVAYLGRVDIRLLYEPDHEGSVVKISSVKLILQSLKRRKEAR